MTFEQKAQSLTAKQIIELMIDAVRNPVIKLDLDDFGRVADGECYGCAATNLICKLSGVTFTADNIRRRGDRSTAIDANCAFLAEFEDAIDTLRFGWIHFYNDIAEEIGIAQIKAVDFILPTLTNATYKENLHFYEQLAEAQDEQ